MAKKLTELEATTSVANGDLFLIVTDAGDSSLVETKKITSTSLANGLFTIISGNNISANLVGNEISIGGTDVPSVVGINFKTQISPANSTFISASLNFNEGDMFYDAGYLYIATSSTELKRVALSSF